MLSTMDRIFIVAARIVMWLNFAVAVWATWQGFYAMALLAFVVFLALWRIFRA